MAKLEHEIAVPGRHWIIVYGRLQASRRYWRTRFRRY